MQTMQDSTNKLPPLSAEHVDIQGRSYKDVASMIGMTFRHSGNGKLYVIDDIALDGVTNEWAIIHSEVTELTATLDRTALSSVTVSGSNKIKITRTYSNFFGFRMPQVPRYVQIPP